MAVAGPVTDGLI